MANDEEWANELVRRVGRAMKSAREGKSASWLSEQTQALGFRISPTVIAKLDSGHRGAVLSVAELLVIAAALGVSPVALLFPDLPDGEVERFPGSKVTSADALWWFTGEHPDFERTGDLDRLLKLTRDRYRKFVQLRRADDLMYRLAQRGQEIKKDDFSLVNDLVDEVDEIERQMREISGSNVWREERAVPAEDSDA